MNIINVISFRALLVMEREKAVNKGNFDFSSYGHIDGNHTCQVSLIMALSHSLTLGLKPSHFHLNYKLF